MSTMRTQRQRVEESTRRLVAAAVELIAEQGYGRTTAKEIGLRAGYSRAMVAERFGSKDALLDAILEDYYGDQLQVVTGPGASGIDALLSPIDGLIELAESDERTLRAMFVLNFEAAYDVGLLRDRVGSRLAQLRQRLRDAAAAGQTDGSVVVGPDPSEIASELLRTGFGLAYEWVVLPASEDIPVILKRWRSQLVTRFAT